MAALAGVLLMLGVVDLDDEPARFRLTAQLSAGANFGRPRFEASPQLGGGLEFGVHPLSWLRLLAAADGLWTYSRFGGVELLGGADLVLPRWWGELFFGVAGGVAYTNVFYDTDCPP